MQKKLMAVAVAGALGALAAPQAAQAQISNVQIGGSLNFIYVPSHNPKNSSEAKRGDIMNMSEPNIFIQGSEKLGGGLTAWFRCETTFDLVDGAANTVGFCSRNSGIGLRGNFGNVFGGNWDSPAKDAFNRVRGWWGGTAAFIGVSGNLLFNGAASGLTNPPGPNTGGAVAGTGAQNSSFWRRQANSWNYHSPVWNGFQVKGQFSDTKETTAIPSAQPHKPRMWAGSVNYATGPLFAIVGYERHKDYNPGGVAPGPGAAQYNGGDDDSWAFGVGYTFGGVFSLRGIYARNEYEVTNTTTLKTRAWGVYGDYRLGGPHTLLAHYVKLHNTKGNATVRVNLYTANAGAGGTGASTWALAYRYDFSKRTDAALVYRSVKNESQTARFGIGYEAPTVGAKQQALGLNFRHRF
jgi:predicted porin